MSQFPRKIFQCLNFHVDLSASEGQGGQTCNQYLMISSKFWGKLRIKSGLCQMQFYHDYLFLQTQTLSIYYILDMRVKKTILQLGVGEDNSHKKHEDCPSLTRRGWRMISPLPDNPSNIVHSLLQIFLIRTDIEILMKASHSA